jgi:hypothetical protein
MRKKWILLGGLAVIGCSLSALLVYNLPPVHSRLAWRVASLRSQLRSLIDPPQEAVFVPEQGTLQVGQILPAASATQTPSPMPTLSGPTASPEPSPTPLPTATPIPSQVLLEGIRHEYQQMNNCGPTTLAMALSYWGWSGDQRTTRAALRPNFDQVDDKNVNPSEMVDYVQSQTGLNAVARVGGDTTLLKQLIAAGFPVIVEKGLQDHPRDWMGHYVLVSGYDDPNQLFITQDSYTGPGENVRVPYQVFESGWWRHFNHTYLVIFPPERAGEVLAILGSQADETMNQQANAQKAQSEATSLSGREQYFALFNLGSSLVALGDYAGAAQAYDQAFAVYPTIPEGDRPWRNLWYQSGPLVAYYYTNRYQDVLQLGNTTLTTLEQPILEEAYYWMGKAREALGEMDKAIYDYQKAYELNPNSTPARQELERLGILQP